MTGVKQPVGRRSLAGMRWRTAVGRLAVGFVVGGLQAAVPLTAQQAEAGSERVSGPVFVETVDVEVINIDVYVTDGDGQPVHGLTLEDFELLVDDRRVAISNFYAVEERGDDLWVRRGEADAERLTAPEPEDPLAPGLPERARPAVPSEQALHVVIYVDNLNLTPFNRNRVLRELRAFIREQLRPEDSVMLVSYNRSLDLLMPFTSDREKLNRALLELEETTGNRVHRNNERRDIVALINDVNLDTAGRRGSEQFQQGMREGRVIGGPIALARNQLIAYAGSVRNDTDLSINALSSVVENLSAAPGRKAVVYVSDGVPMIAGEDMFHFIRDAYEDAVSLIEMASYDMSRRFQQLAAAANANRTSFYTIDARGLTVYSQGTVEQQAAGLPGQGMLIDQIRVTNLQSPLRLMARETGGRSIINANRVMPDLLKIARDFRNYYSLGYMPAVAGTGRLHTIEVRLKNRPRGVDVNYRRGFRTKSIESRMVEGTLSALNLNVYENPLGVRVQSLPAKRRPDGNYDLPLVVEVSWEDLTLIPREGVHHGRIRLWLAAKDEKDRSTEPRPTELTIAVPAERLSEIEGRRWRYGLELTMEGGYHDIGLGLRDDVGGRQAFLRYGVNVR